METPESRLEPGIVARRVGDFVGRRRELRLALRTFRSTDCAGGLIHGMGGVGKSTLAAQTMHRLASEGWLPASVVGEVAPDTLLAEVARRLLAFCLREGRGERDTLRQLSQLLRESKIDWEERLDLLIGELPADVPLVLLLDNFEDNLDTGRRVKNDHLAGLLSRWTCFLRLTSRIYPFLTPSPIHKNRSEAKFGSRFFRPPFT